MNPMQIAAGIAAGVAGAAVWAGLAYYANVEVGYVAWGIGLLVGFAVAATGKNGALPGVAAVLITIVSIVAGKYAAVELAFREVGASTDAIMEEIKAEGDKGVVRSLADAIVAERMEKGEQLAWPAGMSIEDAMEPADYPPGIWAAAEKEWGGKSEEEKQSARDAHLALVEANMAAGMAAARTEGFLATFGVIDLVFFGLAVVTAWGLASRGEEA